jgi:FolB domain-containing protein
MNSQMSVDERDRIFIEDLHLRGIIGLNEWEREKAQDIVVNITLHTNVSAAGESDDASHILNYRSVTKDVIRYVESSSHYLVEALATAIARICVVDHGASRVTVKVEKPGALRFARSVAVEIDRGRSDFA